jgi:hypothetical protein
VHAIASWLIAIMNGVGFAVAMLAAVAIATVPVWLRQNVFAARSMPPTVPVTAPRPRRGRARAAACRRSSVPSE